MLRDSNPLHGTLRRRRLCREQIPKTQVQPTPTARQVKLGTKARSPVPQQLRVQYVRRRDSCNFRRGHAGRVDRLTRRLRNSERHGRRVQVECADGTRGPARQYLHKLCVFIETAQPDRDGRCASQRGKSHVPVVIFLQCTECANESAGKLHSGSQRGRGGCKCNADEAGGDGSKDVRSVYRLVSLIPRYLTCDSQLR